MERTEGWPAGLYLAALWLRGLAEPKAGVRAFHGNHRHVADYLSGEVLDSLDGDTRRFLLETSTLGRFSAPLCDTVLGRTDSAERLRELERTNGFLVALDAHGEWYRYHHLFGELLQLELDLGRPGRGRPDPRAGGLVVPRARADRGGARPRGRGGEHESVARMLGAEHLRLLRSGQHATLLRWGVELPDETSSSGRSFPWPWRSRRGCAATCSGSAGGSSRSRSARRPSSPSAG